MAKKCSSLITLFFLVLTLLAVGAARPSLAQAREKVNLKLLAMSVGGTVYVLSFALAEVVNKNHPWLRIQVQEARGSVGNLKRISDNPGIRKDTLFFTHEVSNVYAREARKPFTTPYKGARAIAAMTATTLVLATLDKDLKTKEDLVGKRFMSMRPGTSTAVLHKVLLNDIWGIGDKVKLSHGGFGPIKNALKDGLVDLGAQPINGLPGTRWAPIPTLRALMATKKVYFFNLSAEDVRALAKKTGMPIRPSTVPAGAIGPKQPNPVHSYGHSLSWWADREMDGEIVYQLTKTIYEHADKFEKYAGAQGKFISRKTMPKIGVPEELFHAGALKFYREKGIKVGRD